MTNAFAGVTVLAFGQQARPVVSEKYHANVAAFIFEQLASTALASEYVDKPVFKCNSYMLIVALTAPTKKRIKLQVEYMLALSNGGTARVRASAEGKTVARELWNGEFAKSSDRSQIEVTLLRTIRPRQFLTIMLQTEMLLERNHGDISAVIDSINIQQI
jgi:hypothetical protein